MAMVPSRAAVSASDASTSAHIAAGEPVGLGGGVGLVRRPRSSSAPGPQPGDAPEVVPVEVVERAEVLGRHARREAARAARGRRRLALPACRLRSIQCTPLAIGPTIDSTSAASRVRRQCSASGDEGGAVGVPLLALAEEEPVARAGGRGTRRSTSATSRGSRSGRGRPAGRRRRGTRTGGRSPGPGVISSPSWSSSRNRRLASTASASRSSGSTRRMPRSLCACQPAATAVGRRQRRRGTAGAPATRRRASAPAAGAALGLERDGGPQAWRRGPAGRRTRPGPGPAGSRTGARPARRRRRPPITMPAESPSWNVEAATRAGAPGQQQRHPAVDRHGRAVVQLDALDHRQALGVVRPDGQGQGDRQPACAFSISTTTSSPPPSVELRRTA